MRRFILRRFEDVHGGVSGPGDVAEGVQFHDGQCVMSWFGQLHAVGTYPDPETLIRIHGHNGKTIIVWEDDPSYPSEDKSCQD